MGIQIDNNGHLAGGEVKKGESLTVAGLSFQVVRCEDNGCNAVVLQIADTRACARYHLDEDDLLRVVALLLPLASPKIGSI